jgi:dTDP-4-dehydrorhamnose reductase
MPNNEGNIYVRSKMASENILKELPGLQLRIRMPLDDRPNERNFIDKIKKYPRLINEQNSITTVPHMIETLKELIERNEEGIYNLTNPGTISAVEIMTMYKEIVDPTHEFEVISIDELDKITKVKRSNCILNTSKLENISARLPEIHEAVKECMIKYREKIKK